MRNIHRASALILIVGLAISIFNLLPLARADSIGPFTFAVFGDNRPNRPVTTQPDVFKKILTEINAVHPAFAVNTGDCIYGSAKFSRVEAQYKGYQDTVESLLKAKTYLAIGNHEMCWGKASQELLAREMGKLYYSFDHGNSHFIVLDSEIVGENSKITGDQLAWLKKDLVDSRAARHRFVFLHEPLFPVGGHRGSSMDRFPSDRDALHSLFVRNRITAIFMGHEHLFHEEMRNGVRYIITGGAGASVYPSPEGHDDFHHYVLVTVDGDNVSMKAVRNGLQGKMENG